MEMLTYTTSFENSRGLLLEFGEPITSANFLEACNAAIDLAKVECSTQNAVAIVFEAQSVEVQVTETDSAEVQLALWERKMSNYIESSTVSAEARSSHADGEVLGQDSDGGLVQWDATTGSPYNSGQSVEEFGISNMSETEMKRLNMVQIAESQDGEGAPKSILGQAHEPSSLIEKFRELAAAIGITSSNLARFDRHDQSEQRCVAEIEHQRSWYDFTVNVRDIYPWREGPEFEARAKNVLDSRRALERAIGVAEGLHPGVSFARYMEGKGPGQDAQRADGGPADVVVCHSRAEPGESLLGDSTETASGQDGDLKLFEVTAAGFDGASDATDEFVFWVAARSADVVQAAIADTGAVFFGEVKGANLADADYTLPTHSMGLSSALLEKASDHRNWNRPVG